MVTVYSGVIHLMTETMYRYSTDPNFMKWQIKNGRSFVFSGTNWEYVSNTFSSLYAVGYHFIENSSGHFIGIGQFYIYNQYELTLYPLIWYTYRC